MNCLEVATVVLLAPGLAYASEDDPSTIEQGEAMNETLQSPTIRLVGKGVQSLQGLRNNQATVNDLTPCANAANASMESGVKTL
ncbi:MAG: hypothetical protein KC643_29025 [Nitrospira sp.]|nr:hypothetical protein [Nitrospira sp.]